MCHMLSVSLHMPNLWISQVFMHQWNKVDHYGQLEDICVLCHQASSHWGWDLLCWVSRRLVLLLHTHTQNMSSNLDCHHGTFPHNNFNNKRDQKANAAVKTYTVIINLTFSGLWTSVHIDDLRRSKKFVSDVQTLRNKHISDLFEDSPEGNSSKTFIPL